MAESTITVIAPSAQKIAIARLADHRLAFTRRSVRRKAGVADVVECEGMSVYGILYSIDADELTALDRKEGAPSAYERADVAVLVKSGFQLKPVPAMTYKVAKPEPIEITPNSEYLADILRAAIEHQLPEAYQAFLAYLAAQFSAGTRNEGLMLTPTTTRDMSAGQPLIRVNPDESGQVRHGKFGALTMGDKVALGKVETTRVIRPGTCQADQTIRDCIGVAGQYCFGHRVIVLPCRGELPRWSPIQPRSLVLQIRGASRNDSEKNYCVMHPDHVRVLGLQEGEFVRLFSARLPGDDAADAEVAAVSIRVFSGSASEVIRVSGVSAYPDHGELYLAGDARRQLKLPANRWLATTALVRPALWPALASRAIFYGLTALFGIGALFQLLQTFAPHWPNYVDGAIALVGSSVLTIALSVLDLRSRFRY